MRLVLIDSNTLAVRTALLSQQIAHVCVVSLSSALDQACVAIADQQQVLNELRIAITNFDNCAPEHVQLLEDEGHLYSEPADEVSPRDARSLFMQQATAAWWCLGSGLARRMMPGGTGTTRSVSIRMSCASLC